MCELFFTSTLDRTYRDALERIFHFNRNQEKAYDAILFAVERYGTPYISIVKDRLWVTLESRMEAQSLFVLETTEAKAELVGVVVYTREDNELVVIFMAVREDYAHGGIRGDRMLLLRMVYEVQGIARRVKGITSVTMFLRGPVTVRIPARTANSRL
jgi:hypothetical protein